MKNVFDYVNYFMQNATNLDNSYDGNMKMQKLLTFSNLINMALNNEPLFSEKLYAFKDGCVVEPVRKRYIGQCFELKENSNDFKPNFSDSEMEVLNITLGIFDKLPARELSDLNHEFDFWKNSYDSGKKYCIVSNESIQSELDIIRDMIECYKNRDKNKKYEKVNDVIFYYDPDNLDVNGCCKIEGKEYSILDELHEFSLSSEEEDKCYSIYLDERGELVIF